MTELSLRGGTSPKFSETAVSSIANPVVVSQKQFREACLKSKTTTRKVARGIRSQALAVARTFKITGNRSKAFKFEYPDASPEE